MCVRYSHVHNYHKFTGSALAFRREETWITRSRVRFHDTSLRNEWVVNAYLVWARWGRPGCSPRGTRRWRRGTTRVRSSWIEAIAEQHRHVPFNRLADPCTTLTFTRTCTVVARGRERDSRDVLFIAHTTNAEKKKKMEERWHGFTFEKWTKHAFPLFLSCTRRGAPRGRLGFADFSDRLASSELLVFLPRVS